MPTQLDTNLNVNSNIGSTVNQFKQLKNELRAATGELAGLQAGTAEYVAAAARVGELRDRVNDLNDSIRATSGAPVENLTNSFGLLSGQVNNLDFEGATNSLSQFTGQIRTLKFSDITDGLKSFTKGVLDLGKAIFANPIFLIAGVLTAVGVAIYALKDKVKFIGEIFDGLGSVISDVTDKLKEFTDWIGISNFALTEQAELAIENAKKTQISLTTRYDQEIKLATAAGKSVSEIEIKKQKAVQESVLAQIENIKKLSNLNDTTEEARKKSYEQIQTLKKDYIAAGVEILAIEAKAQKEKEEKDKANYDKTVAANKALRKQIEDENIAAIKGDEERATAKAVKDKERRDKDIQDSAASASVKAEALKASETQLQTDILAINKTFDEKRKAEEEKRIKEEKEKAALRKDEANREALAGAQLKVAQNEKDTEAKIEELRVKRDIELQNENLTANERLLINQNYFNAVAALRKSDAELAKDLKDKERTDTLNAAQSLNSGLQALSDAFFVIKKSNLAKGSKEEEAAAKKQFQLNKALAISSAVITGIQSVMSAYANGVKNPVPLLGPATGAAYAVIAGVIAAANIAKIASTQFTSTSTNGAGSVGGGAAVPEVTAGTVSGGTISSQFSPETIGQAGTVSGGITNANGQRTSGGNGNAQRVYVLESDITNTQKKVKTIESQASIG